LLDCLIFAITLDDEPISSGSWFSSHLFEALQFASPLPSPGKAILGLLMREIRKEQENWRKHKRKKLTT